MIAGLAARFVSGYIFVPASAGGAVVGGGATHAWMQAYLPGAGWVDLDPTNDIVGNRNLIRVAVAWDQRNALPLWGTFVGPPSCVTAWMRRLWRVQRWESGRLRRCSASHCSLTDPSEESFGPRYRDQARATTNTATLAPIAPHSTFTGSNTWRCQESQRNSAISQPTTRITGIANNRPMMRPLRRSRAAPRAFQASHRASAASSTTAATGGVIAAPPEELAPAATADSR